jgi:predicted nucleotidyltransferase
LTKTEVENLLKSFVNLMKKTYGENLVFIIHHGSWATGEANPDSDVETSSVSLRGEAPLREMPPS